MLSSSLSSGVAAAVLLVGGRRRGGGGRGGPLSTSLRNMGVVRFVPRNSPTTLPVPFAEICTQPEAKFKVKYQRDGGGRKGLSLQRINKEGTRRWIVEEGQKI